MKRFPLILALVVLTLISVVLALPYAVWGAADSSVRVFAATDDGFRAVCSGAAVELPEGPRVVSAGHCVDEDGDTRAPYIAEDAVGRRYLLRLERFEKDWPRADYAVFRSTAAYLLPTIKPARHVRVGEDAYVFTAPLGLKMFLSKGYVSGKLYESFGGEVDGMYLVDLNSDGGSSGSIIVNRQGEALGILVAGFGTEVKLGGAIMAPLP